MPKPTPKKTEGTRIISPEEFMGGAVASNAEKETAVAATEPEAAHEPQEKELKSKTKKKVEANEKVRTVFVGVRIPESTAEMLNEYDQNYALRGESKNSIMAEGIRQEISARLQKAKETRGG